MKTVYCYFNGKEFELPLECVIDCSRQGKNDDAVEYWTKKVTLNRWTRRQKIEGLLEFGAWDKKELDCMSDNELDQKIVWTSSHDAKERDML